MEFVAPSESVTVKLRKDFNKNTVYKNHKFDLHEVRMTEVHLYLNV